MIRILLLTLCLEALIYTWHLWQRTAARQRP